MHEARQAAERFLLSLPWYRTAKEFGGRTEELALVIQSAIDTETASIRKRVAELEAERDRLLRENERLRIKCGSGEMLEGDYAALSMLVAERDEALQQTGAKTLKQLTTEHLAARELLADVRDEANRPDCQGFIELETRREIVEAIGET